MNPEHHESRIEKERGANCEVKVIFLRHAHKQEMDSHASGQISDSRLSEKGKRASKKYGKNLSESKQSIKGYSSEFVRSQETLGKILEGIAEESNNKRVLKSRIKSELNAPHFSPDFIQVYRKHFASKPNNFDVLSKDDQERVVEEIEAPAVQFWLDQWDKKFDDETESAMEVAAKMAWLVTRYAKMTERLKSGTEVELMNVTHKTATEPFIKACVRLPEGIKVGQLGLLEDWELDIRTDAGGNKQFKVLFRDNEYDLDWEKVKELSSIAQKEQK
jgi:broad specificity phosphatase PhoE